MPTACRGRAAEALTWTKEVMTKLGLTLNEAKTSLRDARRDPYNPSPRLYLYMSARPSKKSLQRLKTKVRELLVPSNNNPWPEMRDELNWTLRGRSSYFNPGSRVAAFGSIDHWPRATAEIGAPRR
jgi:RNA-directed DNA polymerase